MKCTQMSSVSDGDCGKIQNQYEVENKAAIFPKLQLTGKNTECTVAFNGDFNTTGIWY